MYLIMLKFLKQTKVQKQLFSDEEKLSSSIPFPYKKRPPNMYASQILTRGKENGYTIGIAAEDLLY